ncbi:MAG: hypothetical protein V2A73_11075, partial [Pseudomonadota bacterium]
SVLVEQHVGDTIAFLTDLVESVKSRDMPLEEAVRLIVRAVAEEQEAGGGLHRAISRVEVLPHSIAQRCQALHHVLLAKVRQLMAVSPEVTVTDLDCASYLVFTTVDAAIHGFVTQQMVGVTLASLVGQVSRMIVAYLTAPVVAEG